MKKKYPSETLARAFEYFSISRKLYSQLKDDDQLPSINLLMNLASKINTTSDDEFLKAYFQKCPEQQRKIVLIIDEIYVKLQLTYQGGNVFGKAINTINKFFVPYLVANRFYLKFYLFTDLMLVFSKTKQSIF